MNTSNNNDVRICHSCDMKECYSNAAFNLCQYCNKVYCGYMFCTSWFYKCREVGCGVKRYNRVSPMISLPRGLDAPDYCLRAI